VGRPRKQEEDPSGLRLALQALGAIRELSAVRLAHAKGQLLERLYGRELREDEDRLAAAERVVSVLREAIGRLKGAEREAAEVALASEERYVGADIGWSSAQTTARGASYYRYRDAAFLKIGGELAKAFRRSSAEGTGLPASERELARGLVSDLDETFAVLLAYAALYHSIKLNDIECGAARELYLSMVPDSPSSREASEWAEIGFWHLCSAYQALVVLAQSDAGQRFLVDTGTDMLPAIIAARLDLRPLDEVLVTELAREHEKWTLAALLASVPEHPPLSRMRQRWLATVAHFPVDTPESLLSNLTNVLIDARRKIGEALGAEGAVPDSFLLTATRPSDGLMLALPEDWNSQPDRQEVISARCAHAAALKMLADRGHPDGSAGLRQYGPSLAENLAVGGILFYDIVGSDW
jgi:hypothetical protein